MLPSALVCVTALLLAAQSTRPPVGAAYARKLSLPLLGAQRVALRVVASDAVELHMSGALALDDRVQVVFSSEHGEGNGSSQLTLLPGPHTRRLLRRARTSLGAAHYDARTDTACIVVHPPLGVPPVRFELRRVG
tara:strand:+ start:4900 stop:5304 length:405 start_codon:yes stop_codon:yes gene_type:complete